MNAHNPSLQRSTRSFFIMMLVSGLTLSSGCATGVQRLGIDAGAPEAGRSFVPPPGKAGVYVVRKSNIVGAAAYWRVFLDAEMLAEVGNNSYAYAAVDPGVHNIQVIYQTEGGHTFTADEGKNYFLVMKVSWTGKVKQISEEEGRKLVSGFRGP